MKEDINVILLLYADMTKYFDEIWDGGSLYIKKNKLEKITVLME